MKNLTGSILLVSNNTRQAKIIQRFQKKVNPEAGKWNHSGVLFQTPNDVYVIEAAPLPGRKRKAGIVITPLFEYTERVKDGLELLFLKPIFEYNAQIFENIALSYVGTPYDYRLLLRDIPNDILLGVQMYKAEHKADRRLACHEFSALAWHTYFKKGGRYIFNDWYKGAVGNLYLNPYFTHSKTL